MYFAILGIVASLFGGLHVALAATGREIMVNLLVASGSMWCLWKGIILFSAGIFILVGASDLKNIHGLGKTTLGSIMIWIIAGSNIFGRILSSIPGEETWFNTLDGFLATYSPPYEPALWLLPFTLVILHFIWRSK
ncbi:MAG: hypothetical protein ACOCTL_02740 [Candidatus Hadarchaeota archaeon]